MADESGGSRQRDAVLEATRELAAAFSARAGEGESLRTMPGDLVAQAKRAGLFRRALPRALGGLALDPATIVGIVEELSRADGSAGWTVLIGNSTAFFAWLEPAVAKEMIGDNPDFASTSMFGPMGQAVPDGDGFSVSGRWPFNSGCPHSEWLQVGVFVMDGAAPRFRDRDTPDWRFAFVRNEVADIEDTWDALGLRGHGKPSPVDLGEARARRAPRRAAVRARPPRGPAVEAPAVHLGRDLDGRLPPGRGAAGVGRVHRVGQAQVPRCADGDRRPRRPRPGAAGPGRGRRAAASAFVFDVVGDLWDTGCRGDPPSLEQRGRLLLAANQAMRAGVEAVDALFHFAGAEAVFVGQPLQRCLRDIRTANQHILFSTTRDKAFAKLRFGIDQATFTI